MSLKIFRSPSHPGVDLVTKKHKNLSQIVHNSLKEDIAKSGFFFFRASPEGRTGISSYTGRIAIWGQHKRPRAQHGGRAQDSCNKGERSLSGLDGVR